MTTNERTPEQVRDASVCLVVEASQFRVHRTVPKDEVNVVPTAGGAAKPDKKMVAVTKTLLESRELRAIETHIAATKAWIASRAVPSELIRAGAYLLSVDALVEVYGHLEKRAGELTALVERFSAAYPNHVREARKKLGPLWSADQYPAASAVASKFSFTWRVVEVGTPDAKLRSISRALFEKERAKAEQVWSSAVGQINQALAAGMADVVGHLAEKIGGGDEKPKRLRQAAVKRVSDFLDTFDSRNLTKNADLAALVEKARRIISGVDAKQIRDDEGLRRSVAAGFAEVKAGLDTMLEDRPGRAITFADEEV